MSAQLAVQIFYGVCITASLIPCAMAFFQRPGNIQRYLLCGSFLVVLLSLGRFLTACADGESSMVAAYKVINFTGCWLWFLILLFISAYTHRNLPRGAVVAMALLNSLESVMIYFLSLPGVFYTKYSFVTRNGLPFLEREGYTLTAYVYFATEFLYLFLAVVLILQYLVKYYRVRISVTVMLIFCIVVPSVVYIRELLVNPVTSLVPLAAAVVMIFLNLIVYLGRVYDMDTIVRDIAVNAQDSAVILVADGKYFLAANEKGFAQFPALKNAVPWMPVAEASGEVADLFSGGKTEDEIGERIYEPRIWNVDDKGQKMAALWLLDVTEAKKHQKFMAQYRSDLEKEVSLKTESLTQAENRLAETLTQTVTSLMSMVDSKDRYTSGHSFRVARYSKMIAKGMGKTKAEQDLIYVTALLHDVGKIHVPDEILNKRGKLTKEEFQIVKLHPTTGYAMLTSITSIPDILKGARWHHERYDGKGYPDGLSGEDIPEIARIIGVADSYDAMTSRRGYRDVLPQEVVRDEIARNAGTQFDPAAAQAMLDLIDRDKNYRLRQEENDRVGIVYVLNDFYEETVSSMLADSVLFDVHDVTDLSALDGLSDDAIKETAVMIDADGNDRGRIAELRKQYPQISIIAISNDHTFDNFMGLISAGADNVIMRPLEQHMIEETLAIILHKNQSLMSWKAGNVSAWSLGWM